MRKIFVTFLLVTALALHAQAAVESQEAGPFPYAAPTAAKPIWGKLVLSGNSVTCYYGSGTTQPTTWTQAGQAETIGFINNPLLVGVFICAHTTSGLASGTIDNVSITPAPAYRLADSDIGSPSLMGSANLINGVWNLTGGGSDIWQSHDQFNFQPWLVYGDCTIICRITSLTGSSPWTKIGIMIRDGYNSGSDYAMFCATGEAGVDFQWRAGFNNNPDSTQVVAPPAPGVTSTVAVGYSLTGPTAYVVRP